MCVHYLLFIDDCVAVVGDRLVTPNDFDDTITVRHVHNGQVIHTIRGPKNAVSIMICILPVPDNAHLLVAAGHRGDVHLWDIEKGKLKQNNHYLVHRCACTTPCAT